MRAHARGSKVHALQPLRCNAFSFPSSGCILCRRILYAWECILKTGGPEGPRWIHRILNLECDYFTST